MYDTQPQPGTPPPPPIPPRFPKEVDLDAQFAQPTHVQNGSKPQLWKFREYGSQSASPRDELVSLEEDETAEDTSTSLALVLARSSSGTSSQPVAPVGGNNETLPLPQQPQNQQEAMANYRSFGMPPQPQQHQSQPPQQPQSQPPRLSEGSAPVPLSSRGSVISTGGDPRRPPVQPAPGDPRDPRRPPMQPFGGMYGSV